MGGGASGQDFHQQKVSALEFSSEQVQIMFIVYRYHSRILNNEWFYHMMLLHAHLGEHVHDFTYTCTERLANVFIIHGVNYPE